MHEEQEVPQSEDKGLLQPPPEGSVLFSGMQPTGELHLGNYLGAVKNWAKLQDKYRAIYCIVDLHALTVEYEPAEMQKRILEMAIGVLACGVDPKKATLFVQSSVPAHASLGWVLGTVTPMGELYRMTQFKEKSEQHQKNVNAGLFTYPILQSADILLYKGRGVPVGEDQLQHIELCRTIARKFNGRYGETFPEPSALLTEIPRVIGLDGQAKMSKSKGNTIILSEPESAIWEKLRTAATDPSRVRRKDPGDPARCNIASLHKVFSSPERNEEVRVGCTTAGIGCFDCKKWLQEGMMQELGPIRERQAALAARPDEVRDILREGARHCNTIATNTMQEVDGKLGLPKFEA